MTSALAGTDVELKTSYAAVLESSAPTFADALLGDMKLVALVKP
jgi:hypothetical protein